MIIHNVFFVKNTNVIPIIMTVIASVSVIMKVKKNTNHPKKRIIVIAMTVKVVMIVKNLIVPNIISGNTMMIMVMNHPMTMMKGLNII